MRILVVPLLLLPLLSACSDGGCSATTMRAQDADKVSTRVVGSSVLKATLTADGKGVPGKTVVFTLRNGDSDLYRGESSARADGSASFDLKGRIDPRALVALARANAFTASFAGDTEYCSSADDGALKVL